MTVDKTDNISRRNKSNDIGERKDIRKVQRQVQAIEAKTRPPKITKENYFNRLVENAQGQIRK